MRRPSIYTQRRSGMDIKMTPMIDVVFLLLVFFVWTASFQIVEQVLPSNLSVTRGTEPTDVAEPTPPEKDFPDIVIVIAWNGRQPIWRVNDVLRESLEEVKNGLQQIAQIKGDAPVIIDPEPNVPLEHVVDVYDMTRLVGFEKVQFAASEEI